MKEEAWLMLMVAFVTNIPQLPANPIECQENEYLNDQGRCSPCIRCGPGMELSKECGYGEGRDAHCISCQPRRFKNNWGHQGCKLCISCSLINRVQKSNCTVISDAVCGECFPGFYRKTRIGGFQGQECIPCTRQTPSSELQCHSRMSLVTMEAPIVPAQDVVFVVLSIGALIIIGLVLLTASILYCQRFWKSRNVFLRRQNFSDQQVTFQHSAMSVGFPCHESLSNSCSVAIKSLSPCQRPQEGPADAVHFGSGVPGVHLPFQEANQDLAQLIPAINQAPLARCPGEEQHLIRDSGYSDCYFTELGHENGAAPSGSPVTLVSSCATGSLHHWPHAPVECTELDLQTLSTQDEIVATIREENHHGEGTVQAGSRSQLEPNPITAGCPACPATEAESFSPLQNSTVESREQPDGDVWNVNVKTDDATSAD